MDSEKPYQIINVNERKKILKILYKLLENEKESICKALYQDLHKPVFESFYLEIKQVQHDISIIICIVSYPKKCGDAFQRDNVYQ